MALNREEATRTANFARYVPGRRSGHYESFFVRLCHADRPLAAWIRYTLTAPRRKSRWPFSGGDTREGRAELWAIVFDGETGNNVVVKRTTSLGTAHFATQAFSVTIAEATLGEHHLCGNILTSSHRIGWDLRYDGNARALFLLPVAAYGLPFPHAKTLVAAPLASFDGVISVDGETLAVERWVGSQNHNWGTRLVDCYAWAQVAGFDTHPTSFLEVITARTKVGPLRLPFFTFLVLRHAGQEIALTSPERVLRTTASFGGSSFSFVGETAELRVRGQVDAGTSGLVGLLVTDPGGATKRCFHAGLARCELTVTFTKGPNRGRVDRLTTAHRAALEVLGDRDIPGVVIWG